MTNEQKELLKGVTRDEIVAFAKELGYDPLKEEKVISQRDKLMSSKASAELTANEHKAQAEAFRLKMEEAQGKATEQEKAYKEFIGQFGDNPEIIKQELDAYKAAENERKAQIETEYTDKIDYWKTALGDDYEKIIPPFEDKAKTLDWMKTNEKRILGDTPHVEPRNGTPGGPTEPSEQVRKFAEDRGISIEAAQRILKKQQE